jgi:hypothetical protein
LLLIFRAVRVCAVVVVVAVVATVDAGQGLGFWLLWCVQIVNQHTAEVII